MADESKFEYESVIEFLDANREITRQSADLKVIEAQALFFAGRLEEAREINDFLLNKEDHPASIQLDLKIAIAMGNWERMGGALECAWRKREIFQAEQLIGFAQLSGLFVRPIDRALRFAKAAVESEPANPKILSAAYFLYFELGQESEVDQQWLHKAVELSSSERGPLWSIGLEELVNDWVPRRRIHLKKIEKKWIEGEIPITVFASAYKLSLTNTLLRIPMRNINEPDTRGKVILWTVSSAREPVMPRKSWTIGMDATTVLILSYLGLLEKVLHSFNHVKIAPETMELLINDFIDVKFHQPSLIESARTFLYLFDREIIKSIEIPADLDQSIVNETGRNVAALIQKAREQSGIVVCAYPIYKPGSQDFDQADTSEFNDSLIPIVDFCRLLQKKGIIRESDYKHAYNFLYAQGQTLQETEIESKLDCPIYLDDLAIKYLQDARILQQVASQIDVYVHPDLIQEFRDLSHEEDIGNLLRDHIERIRKTLNVALRNGDVSLLPRSTNIDSSRRIQSILFTAIGTLLRENICCDAVCFDDRYFNRHSGYTRSDGETKPIICILDILNFLHKHEHINNTDYINYRHKLRVSGFSFVQPEKGELVHLLKQARVENESVVESVELRAYRQYAARLDLMDLRNYDEVKDIVNGFRVAGKHAIVELWESPEIPPSNAKAQSNWLWDHVVNSMGATSGNFVDLENVSLLTKTMSFNVGSLLLPTNIEAEDRYGDFTCWIEQNILSPLLPANTELIESALRFICDVIQSSGNPQQAAYARLFLDQLPITAFQALIRLNIGFAENHDFKFERFLSIDDGKEVMNTKLYKATRELVSTGKEQSVQDSDGNHVSIRYDELTGKIVLARLVDQEYKTIRQIPLLQLLSQDSNIRFAEIKRISDYLEPMSTTIASIVETIKTREPNDQELNTLFDELANGVTPLQGKLVQKIRDGQQLKIDDFVPSAISYFEKFCGPQPANTDIDSYHHDVLTPYRKTLISRDLRNGIDICCLGSLTDSFYPGKWIENIDNDTVWAAMPTLQANFNPFWLLGLLDIALNRIHDSRFRNYSVKIVNRLSEINSENSANYEALEQLSNIAEFTLNRINIIENGARCSSYWKRMAAWMQAGFIFRTITDLLNNTETLNKLVNWMAHQSLTPGFYSTLIAPNAARRRHHRLRNKNLFFNNISMLRF